MTPMIRRLLMTALIVAATPMLAEAQTLSPLAGVTVTTPASGQAAQNFTYLCSVSGCASGVVAPGIGLLQNSAAETVSNPIFVSPGTSASWILGAGSAIVGKVGIDQTTPGTTNGVYLNGCSAGICGLPTVTSNALLFGAITTPMTGTTVTSLIAAVTGQRIYVNSIACQNTSATATLVNVLDGASTVIGNLIVGPGGGDNRQTATPGFATSSGNALEVKNVTTGASVTCNAAAYSSAS